MLKLGKQKAEIQRLAQFQRFPCRLHRFNCQWSSVFETMDVGCLMFFGFSFCPLRLFASGRFSLAALGRAATILHEGTPYRK